MSTAADLRSICAAGGIVSVDPRSLNVADLRSIAAAAKPSGGSIIIRDCSRLNTADMRSIAAAHPGGVTFVI